MPSTNKIKFGLQDVAYAMVTETQDPQTGAWTSTYGSWKAIPGAVNLSLDPEGEENNFYADNIVYVVLASNQGYTGNFEVALLTEEAEKDLLRRTADTNDVIVENAANAIPPYFALRFRIEGDVNNRKYVLYRCALTRPSISGSTKEQSITPATDTVNFKCTPRPDDGVVFAHTGDSTDATTLAAWDSAVYVPQ